MNILNNFFSEGEIRLGPLGQGFYNTLYICNINVYVFNEYGGVCQVPVPAHDAPAAGVRRRAGRQRPAAPHRAAPGAHLLPAHTWSVAPHH